MVRDFDDLLSGTRAELDRLRSAPPPADGPQPATGVGKALDGRIEAEMGADGKLTRLVLDPAVMRMDEKMLAREIITAVNTAWAARTGVDDATAAVAAIDQQALGERLTELQDQGLAAMKRYTDGIQNLLDRLERRVP
ncbi:YbaB/EbfC family nucleoid-associated protein [Catellatospora bangladeshensis]|uniref:YbaB/EbfC DNA-binding family protein n=1 Tax=Catellatospora bangladeshensis TaxID=310355 RepID=A0A8J3JKU3_9ACTN|nr:hypothetical protein Cba03nite_37060 [Catellatospora bangladeshensis]